MWKCFGCAPASPRYPIERKAIDVLGRLGSLYDTSTDKLIDEYSVQPSKTKIPQQHCISQIFSGVQSNEENSFLKKMDFDGALRQSILLRMITPSGICRLVDYNRPINQNTRFLYYSYRSRIDKLRVEARNTDHIVAAPPGSTPATHMITEILWGFEILWIIQIPDSQSVNAIDRILNDICDQLGNNAISDHLINNGRRLNDQLTYITVFGSETCINDLNMSIVTILTRIQGWQSNENFHQPLKYTMQPLRWLYGNKKFPEPCYWPRQYDHQLDQIEPELIRIKKNIKDIQQMLQNLPGEFRSPGLNQRLIDTRQQFGALLDTREDFEDHLQKVLLDVRRYRANSRIIGNTISDQRYISLSKTEMDTFYGKVQQLSEKAILIEALVIDQVQYINAFDVHSNGIKPTTNEDIDFLLKRSFSNENGRVILWYSGDRLKREQPDTWEQIYQQLTSERQQTVQQIKLVYVDFTQCKERLEKFVVVRLSGMGRGDPVTEIISGSQRAKSPPPTPKPSSGSRRARSAPPTPKPSSGSRRARSASPTLKPSSRPSNGPLKPPVRSVTPPLTPTNGPSRPWRLVSPPSQQKQGRSVIPPSVPTNGPGRPSRLPTPPSQQEQGRSIIPVVPTVDRSRQPSPPPKRPRTMTEINVLLLGETGVGKSTFINAFVNYLKFETLEQAERGQPVVLIPVSFLLTVGDQFDEVIVKFGNVDPNEDHEHQGQSVTQQCKSYIFDINDRLRLRLIDTPGIGDTRGVDQDIKNIDHILTYVNTLPHINAVCLLLKPNASRLNVFFRSCVRQLLTYLTPIGFNNIIFCFTNARSTFYAPGDTGRLLREMLNQEHLNDIPFQKANTFCFDSESFRYLAARKCGIDFDEYQKGECKNSWNSAVTESVRLLKFIQTREPYYLEEWQSPRKAVLDISMFARPLMETFRLIIYNWKISEAKLVFNQMILNCNPVDIEMCTHCAQANIVVAGPCWITQYQPALIKTNANQHRRCPVGDKHFLIEAIVQHDFAPEPGGIKSERWESSFHNFLLKCDRIQHFLRQQGPSAHEDPFECILDRFLEEEQQISQIRNINSAMNQRIRQVLQSIKQIRQQNSQQLFESNERLSLREVYQIIDELVRMPTVKKQIDSVKESRQLIMKTHELNIPTNLIKNRTFN